jgi:hypothetical protein
MKLCALFNIEKLKGGREGGREVGFKSSLLLKENKILLISKEKVIGKQEKCLWILKERMIRKSKFKMYTFKPYVEVILKHY